MPHDAIQLRAQRDLKLAVHRLRHRFLLLSSFWWAFVKSLRSFVEYTFPRGLSIKSLFPKSSCKARSFEYKRRAPLTWASAIT